MTGWLLNNGPAVILSTAALIISIKGWYKTRVFYDLEIYTIGGTSGNTVDQLEVVRERLNTGKYTILNTFEETWAGGTGGRNRVRIIIGKIKE